MEDFGKWTDKDLEDAYRLFTLAIKAGDRGAADHMLNGVTRVAEARVMAEHGPGISLAQVGGSDPLIILTDMHIAFEQAFGVYHG